MIDTSVCYNLFSQGPRPQALLGEGKESLGTRLDHPLREPGDEARDDPEVAMIMSLLN